MRRLLDRYRKWRWRRRYPLYSGCWYCGTVTDEHSEICGAVRNEVQGSFR